jgi:hypothetical protein
MNQILETLDIKYYTNINNYLIKNNINNNSINTHLSKLENNIQITKNNNTVSLHTDQTSSEQSIINVTPSQFNDNLYNKPWNKLNIIHKIIKIREFVDNLDIKSEKDRCKLKDELILLLKNKTLIKNIEYSDTKCVIISINNLEYSNGNYTYIS